MAAFHALAAALMAQIYAEDRRFADEQLCRLPRDETTQLVKQLVRLEVLQERSNVVNVGKVQRGGRPLQVVNTQLYVNPHLGAHQLPPSLRVTITITTTNAVAKPRSHGP